MPVFKDAEQLYDCFGALFEQLVNDPKVGPVIVKSGLTIRFNYTNPDSGITIDASQEPIAFFFGDCDRKPSVDMSMQADVAHQFWLGKINLVSALTRGTIVAKGSIPAIMKLLPIISPAFKIYPQVLKEKGLEATIAS
jgi:hypothetical protein